MHAYLPLSSVDRQAMLEEVGFTSFEEMIQHIPASLRLQQLDLPPGKSELEVQGTMRGWAASNHTPDKLSFLGAGVYQRFIPAAVDAIVSRSEFYTAYTPYQPEVSQGTLQYTYEYQTLICQLTGMDVSNASLYDGSTAMAEAAFMAMRITGRRKILVAGSVHPEYLEVLNTYARGPEASIEVLPLTNGRLSHDQIRAEALEGAACLVVACPNFFGLVEEMPQLSETIHAAGGLLVAVVEPTSLAVLTPPGEYGADIVVGDGQSLGNMSQFGGPHVGFMACRSEHFRQLPGRIVGATQDSRGEKAYTLTLQTREQHIRREKATSNICTNQALCALAVTVYLSLAGPQGLLSVAELSADRAHHLAQAIAEIPGFSLAFDGPFINEFVVRSRFPVQQVLDHLQNQGILGGVPLKTWFPDREDCFLIAVTEINDVESLQRLMSALTEFATTSITV
ncbi:MAG: aminomethyl-transferring glycine dehydrogenase subunit GcvPA [Candidatus Sericytochromatia bacterium]|nr:aminomethyl-transferring glycine dehydrogenase subunit GcvPA [Candidatus Sericytochromatia bacterium]